MRLILAAVGKLKDGPERALFQRYRERFDQAGGRIALGPLKLTELAESRAATADLRKADEAQRALVVVAGAERLVALHERGAAMSSTELAGYLARARDDGAASLALAIGGADGHGEALLSAAGLRFSLGPMTLPHGLARIIIAEQLYRAATILSGHPYHRA